MLIVGCEPASVEPDDKGDMGLSAPVKGPLMRPLSRKSLIVRERSHATAA